MPKYLILILFCCFLTNKLQAQTETSNDTLSVESVYADILTKLDRTFLAIYLKDEQGLNTIPIFGDKAIKINGDGATLNFADGVAVHDITDDVKNIYHVAYDNGERPVEKLYRFSEAENGFQKQAIPLWLSIIPPLIAIVLALVFREVIISLFAGIWFGALVINGFSLVGILKSFLNVIDKYIINALTDSSHVSVIVFSLLIGGMVAIISRNGGMQGVVNWLSRFAKTAKSTQFITWLLGIGIFFDDYANTLIVGNTMRPVTDRFKISREKLAYIVDSTAAPISAIAFISTWIGAELGYIQGAIETIGLEESPYSLFVNSLFYSYYPIFTLLFILFMIFMGREYGPMLKAEKRARTTGEVYKVPKDKREGEVDNALKALDPIKDIKPRAINALLPILTVIFGTIAGLYFTAEDNGWINDASIGFFKNLSNMVGESDSYIALLWSSTGGITVALILSLFTGKMGVPSIMESLVDGMKTMLPAICILVLAWALANITKDLYTANYLTSLIQGNISPEWMPAITFLLAGVIAFSTGSSWGTMAILYPLILPATWALCQSAGLSPEATMPIFYNVISVVLAGAVFGDHCSPISDTTILSSLASHCHHIDHVRTQLPYAVTVAIVSVFCGGVLFKYGSPWYVNILVGLVILFLVARFLGRRVEPVKAK